MPNFRSNSMSWSIRGSIFNNEAKSFSYNPMYFHNRDNDFLKPPVTDIH